MRIEFVKDWYGHAPGSVVDCRDGAVLTEGQADTLVRRGLARLAPVPIPAADGPPPEPVPLPVAVAAAAAPLESSPAAPDDSKAGRRQRR
jgi:hypothetical protein